ncbi:hypothetical protein Q1695_007192 [Nippostrongylus brasiliensis]|nr:hypothetical protein Q1695_007192 [Nippostrongylus brasiliensis]
MVRLLVLAAFIAAVSPAKKKKDDRPKVVPSHPIRDLTKGSTFLQRAILYYSYKFPLRDDGSLVAFSEKDEIRGVSFQRTEAQGTIGKLDTPFWRDAPLHHNMDMDADLDSATSSWMANTAFLGTKYIGEPSKKIAQDYLGFSVKQIHEPFGYPFEVPCYSKYAEHLGVPTVFYKVEKRNFISMLRESPQNPIQNPNVTTYLSYVVERMSRMQGMASAELSAWPQLIGRDTGSFTHDETKKFLNEPDGKLLISPYLEAFNRPPKAVSSPWDTFVCAATVDNEARALGVVINVDYVVNGNHPLRYSDMKVPAEEEKKPPEKKEPLPILDHNTNLKIDISWEEWSCCSACCCTSLLCGKFYTPERKCKRLQSVKTRKGYLSLMKINPDQPVYPWTNQHIDGDFQTMMFISPYKEKGIPLFSTIWQSSPHLDEVRKYKDHLYANRFTKAGIANPAVVAHPGIYIDQMPCIEEKYDCVKLAECRGINIKSKVDEELEREVDPCAEYENEFQIIFIEQEQTTIPVHTGKHYRIRIREEVFATDATRASWRVSSRPPGHFDTSKSCLEQGIVLQKNGDLIMTTLTSRDARRHLEITLKLGLGDDIGPLIIWATVLSVFFVLLFLFTKLVHNRRRARTQQILMARMRKRLRAEGKL